MISMNAMRTARDWLKAEDETGRCLIPVGQDRQIVNQWTDQDLADMASQASLWDFSKPVAINIPKKSGHNFRLAHYIPPQDRLVLMAALIEDYPAIYQTIKSNSAGVNYDRPLPQTANDCYLLVDYHDHYNAFKNRIFSDVGRDRWMVHCDVANFATSCTPDMVMQSMEEAGCGKQTVDLFQRAFDSWGQNAGYNAVPQGYAITDILLKLYMVPIDKAMKENCPHVSFYRYVDDMVLSAYAGDHLVDGLRFLNDALSKRNLTIKDDYDFVSFLTPRHPYGVGHGYRPEQEMANIESAAKAQGYLSQDHYYDPDEPSGQLLMMAYRDRLSPDRVGHPEEPNKYFFSYLTRHMWKDEAGKKALMQDLPRLLDVYPGRFDKLLSGAFKNGITSQEIYNVLTPYFGMKNIRDRHQDYQRLIILDQLRRNKYSLIPDERMGPLMDAVVLVSKQNPVFKPAAEELRKIAGAWNMMKRRENNAVGGAASPSAVIH